jgi:hypothetical protein
MWGRSNFVIRLVNVCLTPKCVARHVTSSPSSISPVVTPPHGLLVRSDGGVNVDIHAATQVEDDLDRSANLDSNNYDRHGWAT